MEADSGVSKQLLQCALFLTLFWHCAVKQVTSKEKYRLQSRRRSTLKLLLFEQSSLCCVRFSHFCRLRSQYEQLLLSHYQLSVKKDIEMSLFLQGHWGVQNENQTGTRFPTFFFWHFEDRTGLGKVTRKQAERRASKDLPILQRLSGKLYRILSSTRP